MDAFLTQVGTAVINIQQEGEPQFLLLLKAKHGKLLLLEPDLQVHRYPVQVLHDVLCEPFETPLLAVYCIPERQQAKVKAWCMGWKLRLEPNRRSRLGWALGFWLVIPSLIVTQSNHKMGIRPYQIIRHYCHLHHKTLGK